jgi:hypothetical protein
MIQCRSIKKRFAILVVFYQYSIMLYGQAPQELITSTSFKNQRPNKVYVSQAMKRVAEMRKRSAPEHVRTIHLAKNISLRSDKQLLRTAVDCNQIVCSAAPLPVTLIAFKGERLNAGTVRLNWEISQETNNAGFEIERALNPSNFEKVGFVNSNSTTAKNKTYQFVDENANEEITYYRFKQLNSDGSFTYSRIISINGFKELLNLMAFPNPGTQNKVSLEVRGIKHQTKLSLTVLNTSGIVIYKNDQFDLPADKKISFSNLPKLSPGLFLVKISAGDEQASATVIITDR